jgi:hypothetical protein
LGFDTFELAKFAPKIQLGRNGSSNIRFSNQVYGDSSVRRVDAKWFDSSKQLASDIEDGSSTESVPIEKTAYGE